MKPVNRRGVAASALGLVLPGRSAVAQQPPLRDAMAWALRQSIADGRYAPILAKHDLSRNSVA